MAEIPILLLAAGASRRMGRAKQLMPWGNTTLIEHQVQTLLQTGGPVVVVLGHLYEHIAPLLKPYPLIALNHLHWNRGMGSSIAFGIGKLETQFPEADGALITQLDQPLLTESHLHKLLSNFQAGTGQILVSRSASGWEGVPVLFDRIYFRELKALAGEEGARKIFRHHSRHVQSVESSDVLKDMDTPAAYKQLLAIYGQGS